MHTVILSTIFPSTLQTISAKAPTSYSFKVEFRGPLSVPYEIEALFDISIGGQRTLP